MNIIYLITYIPHLNTSFPKYYVGSKYRYDGKYLGSPSSKKILDFTEGKTLGQWWKEKTKTNPNNFRFDILFVGNEDISPNELVLIEHDIQKDWNVLTLDFFNQTLATRGWVSGPRENVTKQLISQKTKAYWSTDAGIDKKYRLIERNQTLHSTRMKYKWKEPSEKMLTMRRPGRGKGVKDKMPRCRPDRYKVLFNGNIMSVKEAADMEKVTPTTIRKRCRDRFMNQWSYISYD